MSIPPPDIQRTLLREVFGHLATYSWKGTSQLDDLEFGNEIDEMSVPEFGRQVRFRHALAVAKRLDPVVREIERRPSHISGLERIESKIVIRGRLDTARYLARRAGIRSTPRPLPMVQSNWTCETPENVLCRFALEGVVKAMRDNPFDRRSAESIAAIQIRNWAVDRLRRPPWSELLKTGSISRLISDAHVRVRRMQTGRDRAYLDLLHWLDEWYLDVSRLDEGQQREIIGGLMAYPLGAMFWDRVFEIWCLRAIARTLEKLSWNRVAGPFPLHQRTGVIYEYESSRGEAVDIRFQRHEPLPSGRWSYQGGHPLSGIPDISVAFRDNLKFPLLVDAKNRFVETERSLNRAEETYKMLGYAQNFVDPNRSEEYHAVLIFRSQRSRHRVLNGPDGGRLDLVSFDIDGNRGLAHEGLSNAISTWANK